MHAFFHRNLAVVFGSTDFDAASKPCPTGGSLRFDRKGRARPLAAGLRWAALALPLGVFLCAAALSVSPAQAQTVVDLVSNHSGANPSETHTVGRFGVSDWQEVAQQFTTGDRSGGYTLVSVVAHIRTLGDDAVPRVSIYTSTSGNKPGTSLYVLTNPTTLTAFADNIFTAPADAELDANTKYFVVFENTGTRGAGDGYRYTLRPTTSNNQTGESGWSIANNARQRVTNSENWDNTLANAIKIAVRGHVKPSAATGQPGISGKPQVGIKLTALLGSIADRDGLPAYYPDDFTFQWVRIDSSDNETIISGATSHQYRLVAADEDHTIKVKVSFTDRAGFPEGPLVSPATGTIAGWPTGTGVASADALVSNLSRNGDGDGNVGNILAQNFTQAIGFTTGSNRDGYELRSIRAVLDFADSSDGVRVRIFSSSGTTPDSSVATLTNPTIGDGAKEFSAPADTILDKDTLYFVVFDTTSSSGLYSVGVTDSNTTTTAAAGWSLNTQRHDKFSESVGWQTKAEAVLVEINGAEVLYTFPVFTDGRSATRSIEENLGSATDTSARNVGDPVAATDADSGDTLTYSLEGTDAAKFDIDSSTGQIKTKVGQNYDHQGDGTLSVTVSVTDGLDTVSIPVTIYITDHPTPESPLAPAAPTVRGTGTESLSVRWDAPNNVGRPAIDGYDLRYREGTSGDWTDGPQDVTGTSAQITGLVANTVYEAQVRAQNADGEGPWSPAGTGSTYHPGTPGGVLLETTLTTGPSSRQGSGCSSTSDYECADAMNPSNGFVSTDTAGAAKAFAIAGLQLDKIVRSGQPDSYNFHIWFEGVRELRDYEVENLGVEVTVGSDVHRFWSVDTPHGGYHLRHWRNVAMRWELGQTYAIRILDARTFPDSGLAMVQQPLTAEFSDVPESHDGSTAFTVRFAFSDDVDIEPEEMRDHALTVTDATVTDAARVDGRNDLWELTVEPAGTADVGILVPPGRACTEQGALCTADGRSFSVAPGLSIAYLQTQPPQGAALTAEFRNVPPEHDGSNGFTFRLAFSESPLVTFRTLRNQALSASGGTVQRVRRVVQGQNDLWEIRVEPSGNGDVTVTLGPSPACGEPGAICTSDGTPLTGTATATIEGPSLPALSIVDAEVQEGPNAFLRFEITLSEASDDPVTFDIATSDGTAIAGTDYVAKNRSKTIRADRTTAWFRINVIDDSIDEGDETFTVTISNASGATIADGTATGTIRNSDAMPQAWLARFGRTVADQVLDAVEGRMAAARNPGAEVSFAGQRLGGETSDTGALEQREAEVRLEALADWLQGEDDDNALGFESREVKGRELLTGSSFALTGGSAESGFGALWGRAAVSDFDGREDDLALDGEVTSAMLGADWVMGRGSAGLVISHSRGEGDFRSEAGDGAVESTLTGLYPWGRYDVSERLTAWGVVGYGSGELVLTPDGMDPIETDTALAMAALGGRGVLAKASGDGGLEVAATSDALVVSTTSEEVRDGSGSLAASEADVTRLRLGLEGTWRGLGTARGGTFVPTLELGLRHDGGDAETGFGADIGAGLSWTDPALGIEAALRVRGLLTHEAADFRERGFAGSLAWDPAPDSDRGPSLTISQSVGAEASGGMDALLRPDTARALAANDDGHDPQRRRLQAGLGYGLSTFGGRYTATPEIGVVFSDTAREYIHGWRFAEARSAGLVFGVDVEGARRERVAGDAAPEHRLGLGFGWRLEGSGHERFELRFEGARLDAANDDAPEDRLGVRMTARW